MHFEQRERARAYFHGRGIRQAVLSNAATVKWLTGFAPPIQVGPNPFAGGPPLVLFEQGRFHLLVVDGQAEAAQTCADDDLSIEYYLGYTIQAPIDGHGHLLTAMAQHNWSQGVGTESRDLPAFLHDILPASRPIDGWTTSLRLVKTVEELEKLEENFRLSDTAHIAARAAVRAGATEMDVYLAGHNAVHEEAGERVPMGNDYIVGTRQNNIGGWPSSLEIHDGDSFIVDVSTIKGGYWSDSCATYYAGPPSAKQREMHDTASKALEAGAALLRPGAVAREVDRAMRSVIESAGFPVYPHHSGHGVGVTGHEAPRIVPYSEEVLAPGMVIMLEPGIYFPGETSVRLEDGFLVTDNEPRQLTRHDKTY